MWLGILFQWILIIGSKRLDLIKVHILKEFKTGFFCEKKFKVAFGSGRGIN